MPPTPVEPPGATGSLAPPEAHAPSTPEPQEGPTDPIDQAGAALEARAARKPRREQQAEAGRRREAKQEAKERKRQEKERRRREKSEDKERARQERLAAQDETLDEAHPEGDEQDDQRGWELGAPAEALVARLPAIKPVYAAILSGALAGLAAVLLTIGASKGCEAVRDTSSCGGGVGLLAVVAILAIEVLIGANLLKAWDISDPFSTSFLGVGVVATIAMLTFLSHLNSPWMLLVIPLMTAAGFALSWWVTVRFVDEHPMASEIDSERGEPAFVEKHAPPETGGDSGDEDARA